uniref:Uncharacterized protein n=1 Tax=Paravannella minima TaxID=1443144 RepID=A0A411K7K5_9EUKA|nr:hypothetical protein [Paravannella minima]QBC73424.1 hypothetical protein [Paravannella minima]
MCRLNRIRVLKNCFAKKNNDSKFFLLLNVNDIKFVELQKFYSYLYFNKYNNFFILNKYILSFIYNDRKHLNINIFKMLVNFFLLTFKSIYKLFYFLENNVNKIYLSYVFNFDRYYNLNYVTKFVHFFLKKNVENFNLYWFFFFKKKIYISLRSNNYNLVNFFFSIGLNVFLIFFKFFRNLFIFFYKK